MVIERPAKNSDAVLVSKQKWIIIGLIMAIVNPFFAGVIYGLALWRDKNFHKEGKWLFILSLLWGSISTTLLFRYY
jgi:hypothetical protein